MKNLVLKIEYDGTNYGGWQIQPNSPTIQQKIEKALNKLTDLYLRVNGAGRTDAGVHGREQAAHCEIDDDFPVPEEKIPKALNTNLPKDIRIEDARIIDFNFHARFDAIAREYTYNIIDKDSVFKNRFAAFFKYPFEPEILYETTEIFVGRHDFTTFSKYNPDYDQYFCNVEYCEWSHPEENLYSLRIKANRFVYGMIRLIAGAMYDAARGKRTIDDLKQVFKKRDRSLASPMAPPQGLILEKIYYPKEKDPFLKKG